MRRIISKIPRITTTTTAVAAASSSSFSTAGGRGRGFLSKPRSHTSAKVENGAKFSSDAPKPDIFEKRQIFMRLKNSCFDELPEEILIPTRKLPITREEVLELLREVIEKLNKPLFMSNTRIKSEQEWKEIIEKTFNALNIMKQTEEMTKMAKRVSTKMIEAEKQGQTPGAETLLEDEPIEALFVIKWVFDDNCELKEEFINMHIWCIMYINQQLEIWPQAMWRGINRHIALCTHPWETDFKSVDTDYKKDCLDTDYKDSDSYAPKPDIFGNRQQTKIVSSQLRNEEKYIFNKLPTSREEVLELLREVIEKVNKPLFKSYERIKSEEQWKEIVEETLNALTIMRETEEMTKMAKRVSTKMIEAEKPVPNRVAKPLLTDERMKALCQIDWLFEDKREFEIEFINMHIWCIMYLNQQFEIWPQDLWTGVIKHVALCIRPWEADYKKDCEKDGIIYYNKM